MGRRTLAFAAVAVIACFGLVWSASGQGAKAPLPTGEFDGKYVCVRLRSDKDTGYSLEKCQIKQLGDHSFLVGVGADGDDGDKSLIGVTICVAMNDVSVIQVYPTLDRMKAVYADWRKAADDREKAAFPPGAIPVVAPPAAPPAVPPAPIPGKSF